MNISPDKKEGKRRMKKRITKNVTMLALSAGLVGSSLAPATLTHQVHAQPSSGIDQVLSKLTPEQRQAIKQLQTNVQGGLQLSPEVDQKSNDTISVIVEFKDKPEKTAVLEAELEGKKLSKTKAKEKVDAAHETFHKDLQTIFKNDLKQKKSPIKIKQTYKHAFNGVAMTIPANKAKALLDSEAVKAVWSDKEVHIEPPVTEEESKQKEETHTNTTFPGIEKLHHEGFTGEGVKVGILDTGIDYDHPDLQDAYKGGYDFVDNDNDPMETTYDDWVKAGKPATGTPYFTEHGTHVAGIIAGQGKNESDYAVTGVAPDADIYAYRVLGPQGTGSTGAILAGIDQAVEDDMDVINMSLGANYNDPLYVTSIAVNNAVLAGVTAVVSAGNSGNGMYTLGSPGTSPLALTVGANDTSVTIPTFTGTLHADASVSADLKLIARGFDDKIEELKGQNLQVVDGENGSYFDKDVNGKVILDTRGYIDLRSMINNAKKEGAKALLLYNAYPLEDVYLGEGFDSLPVFSISDEQGAEMKEALASGSATFSFDELGDPVVTGGDVLADFSSRGPSRVLYDIKPEVTAPGVSVLSTVPSYVHGEDQIGNYKNAYERLSGTSMASPNVAGVAALLKQTDPDMTPAEIKTRLMNTAAPLNGDYSVFEVGAGRVDPYKAIHAQANIQVSDETKTSNGGAWTLADEGIQTIKETTGALSFGAKTVNGKHIRETRSVTLYNSSEETKTFEVKVEFQTLGKRFDNDYSRMANDAKANGVTVETKDTLKVKAGKNKKTAVTIRPLSRLVIMVSDGQSGLISN